MDDYEYILKNGLLLNVREAGEGDARALLEYLQTIGGESDFLSFGPSEFELSEADEATYLKQSYAADNQLYLVALTGEAVVGSLSFSAGARGRVRHTGEFGLSVAKAYWGTGIGGLLLDTLLIWARTAGIRKINLQVRTDNARAIKLYHTRGFVKEGKIGRGIYLNNTFYDLYMMGLEL